MTNGSPVISIHAPLIGCDKDAKGARAGVKELTYCKNCKNFMHINSTQHICDEFGGYVDKDDFCSRGEKRESKEKETKNESL